MTTRALYPTARPSLLLDFARSRSVDSRVTFARASTATRTNPQGLIETVAANVPRIDFAPTTRNVLGLLIEEARTNVFLNAGGASGGAIGTGTSTGPDGALCRSFTPTAGAASFPQFGSTTTAISLTNGQTQDFAFSAYFAAGVIGSGGFAIEPFLVISFSVSGASPVYATCHINTSAWTIRSTGLDATTTNVLAPTLTLVPSGMYKLTWIVRFTQNATIRNQVAAAVQTREVAATGVFTADGTTNVQYSSIQVELGSFATSYIPTTTAAATRALEYASVNTLTPWYNATEGTLCAEVIYSTGNITSPSNVQVLAQISDNSYVNRITLFGAPDYTAGVTTVASATSLGPNAPVTRVINGSNRIAFAYALNSANQAFNRTLSTADIVGTVPTGQVRLDIGKDQGVFNCLNGWVKSVTYYPVRLADATLQALTT